MVRVKIFLRFEISNAPVEEGLSPENRAEAEAAAFQNID
jgi:hypothetical protein